MLSHVVYRSGGGMRGGDEKKKVQNRQNKGEEGEERVRFKDKWERWRSFVLDFEKAQYIIKGGLDD